MRHAPARPRQPRTLRATLLAAALFAACGGGKGGGGAGAGVTETALGTVRLLAHEPHADAVQVALETTILLEFDAVVALETLADEDTWLRIAGSDSNVPGMFAMAGSGRVRFTPAQPLQPETDYVFQLSALTSDQDGRILDVSTAFGFRTFDARPPTLLGVDVAAGAVGVSRTRAFVLTFDEPIGAASVTTATVFLRDQFGVRYDSSRTVAGPTVTLDPYADLPGDRQFTLVATTGILDRAGNALPATANTVFRTAIDVASPSVVTAWPPNGQLGVSPRAELRFVFDESMDPATVEAASLQFVDEFGSLVAFTTASSSDQRTLRVRPTSLVPNRRYTLSFVVGPAAATDVSGNGLVATQQRTFTTGSDVTAPAIATTEPVAGDLGVPTTAAIHVRFDQELDAAWVHGGTVALLVDGNGWPVVVVRTAVDALRATPVQSLPTNARCQLVLRGGAEGLRDPAGNTLPQDLAVEFTTSADAGTPQAMLQPANGAIDVATNASVVVVFDAPMQPATLAGAIEVTTDAGVPIPGAFTFGAGDRSVRFTPATPFTPGGTYRTSLRGGASGPRRATGNWLPGDLAARFRVGVANDAVPPTVAVTLNGIHASRRSGLVLPPSSFTIDVTAGDANGQWPDMGSVEVLLAGPGTPPAPASLCALAAIGPGVFRVQLPAATPLAAGEWTVTTRVRDLAGNAGQSAAVPFAVVAPSGSMLPFERPQVVWVRADLDRDGNGRPDADDDLLRLGLASAGDPVGSNARMRRLVLDGIIATASRMFGRGSRGEPIDNGSVALRFTTREPIRATHMQMALGGYDPEGPRDRGYGDDSTGVLGRAWYDARNANPSERNTGTSPGLGVFPGEVWLFQTKAHLQVWPSFLTAFAEKFRPLCPDMGGTPAGSHVHDAIVLAPDFDPATANSSRRARWQAIMDAADDWATVIGIVLAHEIGHSVGLVAPGPAPGGLYGDSSLHDSFAGATDVMAPSVGYEAMTTLDYRFRDIDLAYLRQRVVLR
jgi:hypothetical protein